MIDDIHSCSYYCDRPECIKRQRDELRERMERVERDTPTLVYLRNLAMRYTVDARIPECGIFGEIAQGLDAILGDAT